jgi:flagellar biosynthesis/type III secretory pathway protein FliH
MQQPRRQPDWFERHDTELREVAWIGGAARAARPRPTAVPPAPPVEEAAPAPSVVSAEREALDAAEAKLSETTASLAQTHAELANARADIESLRGELAAAHGTTARLAMRMRDEAELELVKLAMSVAERVVARELTVTPELIVDWAREAVAGSDLGGSFVVATSADLAAALPDAAWGELEAALRMDPALPAGTCEVREGGRSVSISAEERLDIVSEELAKVTGTKAA